MRMKTTRSQRAKANRLTVTEAARILGVSRVHLSSVIHGRRPSRKLSARFEALLSLKESVAGK